MKRTIYLGFIIAICCSLLTHTKAQVVNINKDEVRYEESLYPSIEATVNPPPDEVKKAWKDYMNEQFDVGMKGFGFLSNKDVLYAEEVTLESISGNALNFFTKIVQSGDETTIDVFATEVNGPHIDPDDNETAFQTMRQMLVSFLDGFLTDYYRKQVDEKQEEVNDLADEITDLKSDVQDDQEEIEELKEEIQELESEIEKNKREAVKKEESLEEQKENLQQKKSELETIRERLQRIKSSENSK